MSSEWQGLDAFARRLDAAGRAAKDAANRKGADRAPGIVADMRSRVAVDRGDLRGSIRTQPTRDGGTLIKAGGTPATTKEAAGGTVDSAVLTEYGTVHSSPEPFFNNTIEDHRRGVRAEMSDDARNAAEKAR